MFRSHVIGGEPIAIITGHKSKLRAATENFIEKPNNTFLLNLGIEPKTSSLAVALWTTRPTRQYNIHLIRYTHVTDFDCSVSVSYSNGSGPDNRASPRMALRCHLS